jgi:hypothetical protein
MGCAMSGFNVADGGILQKVAVTCLRNQPQSGMLRRIGGDRTLLPETRPC